MPKGKKTHAEKDALKENPESTKHEKTKMLVGPKVTTKRAWEFFSTNSKKFDVCASSATTPIAMTIFRDAYEDMKSRETKIRWVTDITKDNLTHCKDLMQYAEVRHISSLNENFRVSEAEYIAATTTNEGFPIPRLNYSNSKEIVGQQQYIFEALWAKGVPAEHRIREIEQDVEPQRIEVIYNAQQALELYQSLIISAEKEIKVVFPTTNALIRQDKAGILFLLQEAAAIKKCQVKILVPNDELIRNFISNYNNSGISTRFVDQHESGRATILIVDNKVSLMMELKDDSKKTFHEAIGLSTYSNSKAGVLSYVSMFESVWKQTELYEELKSNEKMQKEFINTAAHELRTPVQPILGMAELIELSFEGGKAKKDIVVYADKGRISEVISNILDNAIKFTHNGNVTISADINNNGEVIVVIRDEGTGIDDEISSRLFTKFATKSEKGTGLGLYISKSIVEAHGGKIWAKNNIDDKGATFGFSLPLNQD